MNGSDANQGPLSERRPLGIPKRANTFQGSNCSISGLSGERDGFYPTGIVIYYNQVVFPVEFEKAAGKFFIGTVRQMNSTTGRPELNLIQTLR